MPSLDDIFLNAREITDSTQRAAYVAQACGTDSELRERVEALLRDAEGADAFFGKEATMAAAPVTEAPGALIGRYKLLQKIGEGGMGIVYMAEQREPVVRKVALKIIKLGMDTRQVVARFEAERQALALMDHPNIAKVLDAGPTDTGRPYFVMDLVQGLPITKFCDDANLPTRERIDLFLDVCSAIQHAHQKGIIHRDLKPSNILVTLHGDKPVPKVIDFGVAKATQGRLTEKTLFTQFQQFIGTPAYMSPEQASLSGLDVDTRSDIYALGVLLYELLTGKTPFDATDLVKAGLDEMRRTLREEEPPRPSARLSTLQGHELTTAAKHRHTEPPKLVHLVRGDLDWIVMKCLEKDRARRYETANGLVADLRRHLENEPVTARPPSTIYRIQKAARRHKAAFAAAAVIVVVLAVATVVSVGQAVRATRAEREARKQADLAQKVKSFLSEQLLVSVSSQLDEEYDPKRVVMVNRAAQAVEGQFINQPLIEAEIRYSLGLAFNGLSAYAKGAEQHQRAAAIFRRELGREHSNTIAAQTGLALAYDNLERRSEAGEVVAEAIAAARTSPQLSVPLAGALHTRGHWLAKAGRTEATNDLVEAFGLLKQSVGENHIRVTGVLFDLALVALKSGARNDAEKLLADGVNRCVRLHGAKNPWTGYFLKAQGSFLLQQRRYDEAVRRLDGAWTNSVAAHGPDALASLECEDYLAQAHWGLRQTHRAVELFGDVSRRWVKLFPFANARNRCLAIADWFARHERADEAATLVGELVRSFESDPPHSDRELVLFIRTTAAARGWPAAAELCRANFRPLAADPELIRFQAAVFSYAGDAEWYRKTAARALALAPTATNWDSRIAIIQTAGRGPVVFTPNQSAQSDALIETLRSALPDLKPSERYRVHRAIGALQLRLGRPAEALIQLEAGLRDPARFDSTPTLFCRALCLHRLGRADEARATFDAAEVEVEKYLPEPRLAYEGFLNEVERFCLLLQREVRELIGGK